MSPSLVSMTPPEGVKTAELTAAAVAQKIEVATHLRPLDASRLTVTKTSSPMAVPALDDPVVNTSSQCTDHMVSAVWRAASGWDAPELKPYGNLSIAPTASVLHYATECFEGLKMYRGYDGKLRLFRPDCNAKRLLISSTRVALPAFDPAELEKLLIKFVATDGPKWLPRSRPGTSLYLRPTMIGSAGALGVSAPKEATLFIISTFMPNLTQPKGLKLLASQNGVRAWPGGFGYAKLGANYGPSLMANSEAVARGYHQVLWLLNGLVTEAGASNFFVVWTTRDGRTELVTAPLDDKIILDGITRRSILQLARERLTAGAKSALPPVDVVERQFTIDELADAVREGRLIEAFAAGTAFFVSPVAAIGYNDQDLEIPMKRGDSGDYAAVIKGWLVDIMYGREEHPWGVVVDEDEE